MVPSNFNSYWDLLTPLMKKDNSTNIDMKNKLFELVVTRDTIGESMWYIYTGLLITSIVQLKIATRGCASNPKTMEQNYHKFLDSEKQAKQKSSLATSSTYTITN
jgi:type VI protein secretion system component Hcp